MKGNIRKSNFEVLRLLCMLSIVFYHLLLHRGVELSGEHWLFKASNITFHFGVVVFVLISGWFGIRLTWRRLLSVYVPLAVYTIGIDALAHSYSIWPILLLSDNSSMWFIQPYIHLCLLAPFVNKLLSEFDKKNYAVLLSVLGLFVFVFGFVMKQEVASSKSLMLFCFLYVLGRMLRIYFEKSNSNRKYYFWGICLIFSFIYLCKMSGDGILSKLAGSFFAYNSIGQIVYSVLILLLFASFNFHSKIINYVSASSFAIYVIGSNPFVINVSKGYVDIIMADKGIMMSWGGILALAVLICIICLLIDIMLRPIICFMIDFFDKILNKSMLYVRKKYLSWQPVD